ncbi:hypothetical protein ABPG72_011682 [Tetrahymena utriculariae]
MVGSCLVNKNQDQTQQNGNSGVQRINNKYPITRLTDIEMRNVFINLWKYKGFRDYGDKISKELYLKLVNECNQKMKIAYAILDDDEREYAFQQFRRLAQIWNFVKTELITDITIGFIISQLKKRRLMLKRVKDHATIIKA